MILGFSSISKIQLRLPAGNDNNNSILNIIVSIRDTLDCITESTILSVTVISNMEEITNLVDDLQNTQNKLTNNPLVQILSSGNQNTIGQVITLLSLEFNKINNQTIQNAVASKIIIISSIKFL